MVKLTADISTQEVLIRTYDLVPPPPPGSHHLKDVSSITERLRGHEKRKEERRIIQMRNAREKVRAAKEAAAAAEVEMEAAAQKDEPMEEDVLNAEGAESSEKRKQPDGSEEIETAPAKKARTEGPSDADATEQEVEVEVEAPEEHSEGQALPKTLYNEPEVAWSSMVLTKPSPEMRGHTSYLTFATFYPAAVRAQMQAQEGNTTALPTRAGSPAAAAE